ncbi:MAG: hypothetical protein JW760_07585 [Spirochaetales bacterium]|nr:hypothetical protein [Spirochaetales bacterium]
MQLKERIRQTLAGIRWFFEDMQQVNRDKATGIIDYEIQQMENIFSLLVCGSFIGMASPPVHLTLQLLPVMEREVIQLFNSVTTARDALGELSEMLGEP